MEREVPLAGGTANAGAVARVGDVVLRPAGPHTPAVHALLRHLHDVGFNAVPEPLGVGPDGRERLRYITGDTACPPFPKWSQTERALSSTAALLRRFHDAQAGFVVPTDASWSDELADPLGGSVICHNDVCPENVVFRRGEAVALVDFDFAAPGHRLHDLAQLAKMCVPLDTDEDAARFGRGGLDPFRRLRLVADGYGLRPDRTEFLELIRQSIEAARGGGFVARQIERGHASFVEMVGAMGGLERYERRYRWFEQNLHRFAEALE